MRARADAPHPETDLAELRVGPRRLYSAAELIGHAGDLCSDSAGLVADNERRWRTFRQQVVAVTTHTNGQPHE